MAAVDPRDMVRRDSENLPDSIALLVLNTMQGPGAYQGLNPSTDYVGKGLLAEPLLPLSAYGTQKDQKDPTSIGYGNMDGNNLFAQNLANMYAVMQNVMPQRDIYRN